MQGMPAKLLTQNVAKPTVKGEVKSPVNVNTKVASGVPQVKGVTTSETPVVNGETPNQGEGKNAFADLFSGLIGSGEKVTGKNEKLEKGAAITADANLAQANAEIKVDTLLKSKSSEQAQDKNAEVKVMTTAQALSPEVLKNIDNLLVKTPVDAKEGKDVKGQPQVTQVSDKIAETSTNLDQLLKALKGDSSGNLEQTEDVKESKNTKTASPLDFLLKQSGKDDVATVEVEGKDAKALKANPEMVSKLGLSSEDFVGHMAMKDAKINAKTSNVLGKINLEGESFDPKELMQKQLNSSVKNYGQKQNLLNDSVIRTTNDFASKELRPKASADELKTPDMKIGAELSHVKDSFVPLMNNKQENAPQVEAQNSGKVLDLSKMNASSSTEIIKKITDYVQQNQVSNSTSLDLTVKHDSLGQFKIQVNKPMDARSTHMDMQITTTTAEGHDFFMRNEIGLMKNLSQAGIQLSDLRIVSGGESASFTQNDSRQSGHNQQQAPREFMSFESGDSSQGSDRRRELWQEARANQQRYGA